MRVFAAFPIFLKQFFRRAHLRAKSCMRHCGSDGLFGKQTGITVKAVSRSNKLDKLKKQARIGLKWSCKTCRIYQNFSML